MVSGKQAGAPEKTASEALEKLELKSPHLEGPREKARAQDGG